MGSFVDIFATDKKYRVIYADPPWEYRQSGSKEKARGMAKQHYNTMPTADICNLPIQDIKTEDAICFMWATFPNIDQALKVMESWGFIYKTAAFVWVKTNAKSGSLFWGMGQYTRANAEVCLIGISKRTKAKEAVTSHAVHQIVIAPFTRHSRKPPEVRDRIKKLIGGGAYIELFARETATGWDCWGNEVGDD